MRDKYVEECAVLQQNSTYTAEAHHRLALSARRKALWLEVVPAVCAAITGALVAADVFDDRVLFITILSASVSAVAAVLNPNKTSQDHLSAARSFTALKHDARFLREAQSSRMTDDTLVLAVENLHQRYNELLKATPPTDDKVFAKARAAVQSGIHEPDRDSTGKVK